MTIDFPSFPELVQEKILDRLDCYDLYNFSESSKWSRSLSIRPAKRHEGTIWVSLVHNEKRLKLSYESSSHPQSDVEVILEFKDSKFENLEKYLSVRHSTLFANVTIYLSYWCSAPFESTFITFDRMTQLGYPIVGCGVNGVMSNEAIVRVLMTFRKAERVNMGFRPTGDFTNFDFVTPVTESLENELLEIRYSKWVSPWLINNAFNKCREVKLFDHYFVESDVIEILKSWRTGSSIRKLLLFFDLDGSIEDFGAKMIEINAAPVQEAFLSISQKRARLRGYVSSAWLLKQNNTGAEVLVTVGSFSHNGTHKQFHMKDEFELLPETR
ncbi:unnamed protein product [Caenorhabditis nigoni]